MKLFEKCPHCGKKLVERKVEKLLRGGVHTATLCVKAEVCLHCGERLYTPGTVRKFEEVRKKLECGEVKKFQPLGKSFQVA